MFALLALALATETIDLMLAASTATAAASGLEEGDVTVLLSQELHRRLDYVAKSIVKQCNDKHPRIVRREARHEDVVACEIAVASVLVDDSMKEKPVSNVFDKDMKDFAVAKWNAIEVPASAPHVLRAAWKKFFFVPEQNKFAVLMASVAALGVDGGSEKDILFKLKFKGGLLGAGTEKKES
jgi:hypothetical protein